MNIAEEDLPNSSVAEILYVPTDTFGMDTVVWKLPFESVLVNGNVLEPNFIVTTLSGLKPAADTVTILPAIPISLDRERGLGPLMLITAELTFPAESVKVIV
jgi:hypothetical protein